MAAELNVELVELNVNYNNVDMVLTIDKETADQIIQDSDFAAAYMEANFGTSPASTCTAELDSSVSPFEEVGEVTEVKESHAETFTWTDALIRLMIDTRIEQDVKFQSPKGKKNKLWTHVANLMKTAEPEIAKAVSGEACDKKWRNLIITYKKILSSNSKTGRGRTSWAYFDQLNNALGNRANINPPPGILGGSLESEAPTTEMQSGAAKEPVTMITPVRPSRPTSSTDASTGTSGIEPNRLFSRGRKRANETSLLMQELASRKEKEVEKVTEKRTRWEEKQKIEEERTNAIKSLADAIKLLANKK